VTRAEIVAATARLRAERLLDWTGGALSARSEPDRMTITPAGAARRHWVVSEPDLVDVPLRDGPAGTAPAGPRSTGLHAALHRQVPSAAVVVHTHAGSMFLASCLARAELPVLPPTRKFGAIPLTGTAQEGAATDQERTRSTVREVEGLLPAWVGRLYRDSFVFLDREHGAYAFSSSFDLALVALAKLEASCALWLAYGRAMP
jgi:ribulose-5-phosphate 4-epimerase/fuculose-1-phosphate aldolase